MVCYTKLPGKEPLETVWKRAGTFKKYLAGDWTNHLSITVCHRLTSTNQNNSRRAPGGISNSYWSQLREEKGARQTFNAFFLLYFQWNKLFSSDITDATAVTLTLTSRHYCLLLLGITPKPCIYLPAALEWMLIQYYKYCIHFLPIDPLHPSYWTSTILSVHRGGVDLGHTKKKESPLQVQLNFLNLYQRSEKSDCQRM